MLYTGAGVIFCRSMPREASNRAIEPIRDIMGLSQLSILHEEPPFIGFEAGARLRAPGKIFSVRRIERRRVSAGTRGNFLWLRCSVRCPQRIRGLSAGDSGLYSNRHDENFVVRAGRFDKGRSGFGLDVA